MLEPKAFETAMSAAPLWATSSDARQSGRLVPTCGAPHDLMCKARQGKVMRDGRAPTATKVRPSVATENPAHSPRASHEPTITATSEPMYTIAIAKVARYSFSFL